MDYQVLISSEALNDLESVVACDPSPGRPDAGERLVNRLLDAASLLRNPPQRSRVVPEFRQLQLHEILVRSFRIIYRVNPAAKTLEIVRFWHTSDRFPRAPKVPSNWLS